MSSSSSSASVSPAQLSSSSGRSVSPGVRLRHERYRHHGDLLTAIDELYPQIDVDAQRQISQILRKILYAFAPEKPPSLPRNPDAGQDVEDLINDYNPRVITESQRLALVGKITKTLIQKIKPCDGVERVGDRYYFGDELILDIFSNCNYVIANLTDDGSRYILNGIVDNNKNKLQILYANNTHKDFPFSKVKEFIAAMAREIVATVNKIGGRQLLRL